MTSRKTARIPTLTAAAFLAVCPLLYTQTPDPVTQINFVTPNTPIPGISAGYSGPAGGEMYCYWLVAEFTGGGKSSISSPACVQTSGLSVQTPVVAAWGRMRDAAQYYLLRTTDSSIAGSCVSCLLTSTSGLGFTDDGSVIPGNFTISGVVRPSSATVILNNTAFSPPLMDFSSRISPRSLGSGSPSASTFLRGDGTWAIGGGGGGAPTTAQYWLGQADGSLTNGIVVNDLTSLESAIGGYDFTDAANLTGDASLNSLSLASPGHSQVLYMWNGVVSGEGALFYDQAANVLTAGTLNANAFTVAGNPLAVDDLDASPCPSGSVFFNSSGNFGCRSDVTISDLLGTPFLSVEEGIFSAFDSNDSSARMASSSIRVLNNEVNTNFATLFLEKDRNFSGAAVGDTAGSVTFQFTDDTGAGVVTGARLWSEVLDNTGGISETANFKIGVIDNGVFSTMVTVTGSGTAFGGPESSVTMTPQATPGNPAAGDVKVFLDSGAAGRLTTVDDSGATEGYGRLIGAGTIALGTSEISAGACDVATAAATGVTTTDVIAVSSNSNITAVTGYVPGASMLAIYPAYPTANQINIPVCNPTGSPITPGAVTLRWRVTR